MAVTLDPTTLRAVNELNQAEWPLEHGDGAFTSNGDTDYARIEELAALTGLQPLELVELAIYVAENGANLNASQIRVGIIDWLETTYYIPETQAPIVLADHQKTILEILFGLGISGNGCGTEADLHHYFMQMVYSAIKKSGKTSITGGVAEYVTETWTPFPEVLTAANDLTQSRTRIYKAIELSLKLRPGWDDDKRTVRDTDGALLWRIIESHMSYIPSGGIVRALSSDFRGEAGANPTATFFSELWGFTLDKLKKLWDEMVPPPTRKDAFRWAETYAGFTNEKGPLWNLFQASVISGRQLTCHDMKALAHPWPNIFEPGGHKGPSECNCYNIMGCCPEHDQGGIAKDHKGLPLYINDKQNLFAYWDTMERARRMPWQTQQYYVQQREMMKATPKSFDRLHLNLWTESQDAFVEMALYDQNVDSELIELLTLHPETYGITLGQPVVISVDAAVSNDCCALGVFTRHPNASKRDRAALRAGWVWYPPEDGKFNYQDTIEKKLRELLGCVIRYEDINPTHDNCHHGPGRPNKPFNVIEVAYDAYQLHDMMTRIQRDGLAWCNEFSQGADRSKADKALLDNIVNGRFPHPGNTPLKDDGYSRSDGLAIIKDHIGSADKKIPDGDNTRMRIVKRDEESKIDGAVVCSMGQYETMRLDLVV